MGELLGVESGGKVRSFNFNLALIDHLLSPKLCAAVALGFFFFFFKQIHEVSRVTHNLLR